MKMRESYGQIIVILTPQEHTQLCVADTPNHKDQPAGMAIKRQIQEAARARMHMGGDCRVTLHVAPGEEGEG